MKNILIIGNEGYIGPIVIDHLRKSHSDLFIAGFDIGYFTHLLSTKDRFPERHINVQHRGDVRQFPMDLLKGFDAVIYLAAISNDPMGKKFEEITFDVNWRSAVAIAKEAKNVGVHHFVYASSCSVYGLADDKPRTEDSELNPLTAYAKSKVWTEKDLKPLASNDFIITCLRFATACGFSPRLRLDLVLNDFVASAVSTGKIEILSDGMPWRPLIHVKDMARAFDWASQRKRDNGGEFLNVNTGSNDWNHQIKDLALAVEGQIKGVSVFINKNAEADNRSYKVDFSKFTDLAPDFVPHIDLPSAVREIQQGLNSINFKDKNFRQSQWMRLNVLRSHQNNNRLGKKLDWIK